MRTETEREEKRRQKEKRRAENAACPKAMEGVPQQQQPAMLSFITSSRAL